MERRVEPKHGATPARALVCHAPGTPPPAALLQALERRAFVVENVPGTHLVLARAVLIRHDPQTSHLRLVVVLVQPRSLSRPGECLDALRNMPGGVACWVFDAASGELRAASAVDLDEWSEKNASESRKTNAVVTSQNSPSAGAYESAARSAPALRFTGDWPDAAQATGGSALEAADAEAHAPTPPALLTDEELEMLLGDDTGAGPTVGPDVGSDLGSDRGTGSR